MIERLTLLTTLTIAACGADGRTKSRLAAAPFADLIDTTKWITSRTPDYSIRHPRDMGVVPDTDSTTGFVGTALVSRPEGLRFAVSFVGPFEIRSAPLDPHPPVRMRCSDPGADLGNVVADASPCGLAGTYYEAFDVRHYRRDAVTHEVHVRLHHHLLLVTFGVSGDGTYSPADQLLLYQTMLETMRDSTP